MPRRQVHLSLDGAVGEVEEKTSMPSVAKKINSVWPFERGCFR